MPSPLRALYLRLHARYRDPAAGECDHSFGKWSDPEPVDVQETHAHWLPSEAKTVVRDGLFQDRSCLKCNLYQRRLA